MKTDWNFISAKQHTSQVNGLDGVISVVEVQVVTYDENWKSSTPDDEQPKGIIPIGWELPAPKGKGFIDNPTKDQLVQMVKNTMPLNLVADYEERSVKAYNDAAGIKTHIEYTPHE